MNNDRVIPNNASVEVANFDLLIDGDAIPVEWQVLSVTVEDEVNKIATATIVLRDGESADETFSISEQAQFVPGNTIEIKIGYDADKKTVFKGIVARQCIRARGAFGSQLTVVCKHSAAKMCVGRNNKYFEQQKDSEVMEALLGKYNLAASVESTELTHKELVQFHCTDWDLLLLRAEANGMLVFADGDKIAVKKPDTGTAVALSLTYGSNLLEIEAEMDALCQWKSVKASSWDYAAQATTDADASSAPITEPGNLSGATLANAFSPEAVELRHTGQVLPEELKTWANAAMLKNRLAKIRGRARITGYNLIKPGDMVELLGCGARFNGKVYVTGLRHEVVSGLWITDIQFGLSPEWFYNKPDLHAPPAAGLAPAVRGLQIGTAVQLEKDPDGENRILVRLPILDAQAKGVWARVCTLDAGNNRGSFFLPEIGDEVIVGFLNDDPRDPVVLGMAHSSNKPAPLPATDDNHIKGFQTRSKMIFLFDDDQKTVTLETPAGNKLLLSEADKSITLKDQHGNSIVLDNSGIALKSIKDITVDATQNVNIKAGMNLKAEGSVNAEIKGGVQLAAKGGASAEFSSGGATQVKGAILKLN
jgi:Rhs element Vgr protein